MSKSWPWSDDFDAFTEAIWQERMTPAAVMRRFGFVLLGGLVGAVIRQHQREDALAKLKSKYKQEIRDYRDGGLPQYPAG